jgi:hypothetical protein
MHGPGEKRAGGGARRLRRSRRSGKRVEGASRKRTRSRLHTDSSSPRKQRRSARGVARCIVLATGARPAVGGASRPLLRFYRLRLSRSNRDPLVGRVLLAAEFLDKGRGKMGLPVANNSRSPSGVRRTAIGAFNVSQPGRTGARTIPVPWIDCNACSWRHYPGTTRGLWHIATTCVACGAELESAAAAGSQPQPVA